MSKKQKLTQSEIDGVQYRRAKLWQIILIAFNALVGMSVYSLIGMASYSASIGYGISTALVGMISFVIVIPLTSSGPYKLLELVSLVSSIKSPIAYLINAITNPPKSFFQHRLSSFFFCKHFTHFGLDS